MNIFVTSPDPKACAVMLDDQRLNKMIVESCQMLSSALHYYGLDDRTLVYKDSYTNHPCTVWTRGSYQNYDWHCELLAAMLNEYSYRFGKYHSGMQHLPVFNQNTIKMPEFGFWPFANCSLFKADGIHVAYQKTMVHKWKYLDKFPTWTKRDHPQFITIWKDKV